MAEIGVIASGIGVASFAIQVADSILKLKGFLDSVKDAPEEIKYLIEEIDTLSTLLSEFDTDILNGESELDSSSVRKCWEHCSRALRVLQTSVRELDVDIGRRRRVGSFKAVLKKVSIERLKDRLKSAQIMLLMAHQIYSAALQKQNSIFHRQLAEVQQEQLLELRTGVFQTTKIMVSIQETITSSQSNSRISEVDGEYGEQNAASAGVSLCPVECLVQTYRRIGQASKKKRRFEFRLQAPSWLKITNNAIEVRVQQAPFGWEFTFEMYNIVDDFAPIMEYAEAGDIAAIQEIFTNRKASPNDRTWHGETVLGRAVAFGHLEVCRLLREQGAGPYIDFSPYFGNIPAVIRVLAGMYRLKGAQHQLDLARLLSDGIDLEEVSLDQHKNVRFRGHSMLVSWLRSETTCDYDQLDLKSRVCFAINICSVSRQPYVESLIRGLLDGYAIDSTICEISDQYGRTLLHSVSYHFGEQYHTSPQEYSNFISEKLGVNRFRSQIQSKASVLQSLLNFVSELVVAGSDLHALKSFPSRSEHFDTPLTTIIYGYQHSHYISCQDIIFFDANNFVETNPEKVLVTVFLWLRVLESAGIDLEEYGRKEKAIYQKGLVRNTYEYWFPPPEREQPASGDIEDPINMIYSFTFVYGPTPTDWKFWLIEQMDDSFSEFWDMVDHPERAMPGYWDERFDEMED